MRSTIEPRHVPYRDRFSKHPTTPILRAGTHTDLFSYSRTYLIDSRFLEWSRYGCDYYPHDLISKCNGIHKGVRVPAAFNLNAHARTYAHLAVRSITGFLHQLYSVFRTRLDTTFEWLGVPVASRSTCATVLIYSYKKHTELKHRRTRFWGFEDSRLRPKPGQCRTQTVRKRPPGTPSGEPSTCRDRSYRES